MIKKKHSFVPYGITCGSLGVKFCHDIPGKPHLYCSKLVAGDLPAGANNAGSV